jgi:hypothetical protein
MAHYCHCRAIIERRRGIRPESRAERYRVIMSHPRLHRMLALAAAVTAVTLIAGTGALPASAASRGTGATVTRTGGIKPDEIVGVYKTYSKCNAAGAKGIRERKWINYYCDQHEEGGEWYLSVERPGYLSPGSTYTDKVTSSIACAYFSGDIGWGGLGIVGDDAYLRLQEPYSLLEDTCSSGYARLYIHYDTVDNPKTIKVIQIGPHRGSITRFLNKDDFNTYKDIYIYICSQGDGHYRCGNHKGPGA